MVRKHVVAGINRRIGSDRAARLHSRVLTQTYTNRSNCSSWTNLYEWHPRQLAFTAMGLCGWAVDGSGLDDHSERLNREHALGQQMRALIDGPASYTSQRIHIDVEQADKNTHQLWSTITPTDWVTRAFCEKCNGGWMARMDDGARPVLERMMRSPTPLAPTPEESRTLADWAFKVSIVFEFIAASTERHTAEVRANFFRTRRTPDHAAVALGAASFTHVNAAYGLHTSYLPLPGAGAMRVFTLLLRHVVIQVASQLSGRPIIDPLDLLPLRSGARFILHPPQKLVGSWPPQMLIDSESALRHVIRATAPFPADKDTELPVNDSM